MAVCDKQRYLTKPEALRALNMIFRRSRRKNRRAPTGAYFCGACRTWHLTSKSATQTAPWERHWPSP
jgi:hypothetical protein